MNINHHNYEVLLLDYLEGRLDAVASMALRRFIEQHPALGKWAELTAEWPEIKIDNIEFLDKKSLMVPEIMAYRGIDEHNFEEYFTAWHEDLLSVEEKAALEQFLALNRFLEADFRLAGRVYLLPDSQATYPDKNELFKKGLLSQLITNRTLGVAATLTLLLTLSLWWFRPAPFRESVTQVITEIPASHTQRSYETEPLQSDLSERNAFNNESSAPNHLLPDAKSFDAGIALTNLQRYDMLPEMKKKETGTIKTSPFASLAIAHDDLESRLLMATILESELSNQTAVANRRIQKAVKDLSRMIDFLQPTPERLTPENLLATGVGVYNLLTDGDVELTREYQGGQLQAIALYSERIAISKAMP